MSLISIILHLPARTRPSLSAVEYGGQRTTPVAACCLVQLQKEIWLRLRLATWWALISLTRLFVSFARGFADSSNEVTSESQRNVQICLFLFFQSHFFLICTILHHSAPFCTTWFGNSVSQRRTRWSRKQWLQRVGEQCRKVAPPKQRLHTSTMKTWDTKHVATSLSELKISKWKSYFWATAHDSRGQSGLTRMNK